jgi:hypothetical protein
LRASAKANGVASLVQDVAIPKLDLGFLRIDFAANLPKPRVGMPAIGAVVSLPSNPPHRPMAQNSTVTFNAPDDRGFANLQLAIGETVAFGMATFVVVTAGHSVHRFDGPSRNLTATWIELQPADFQVNFAHITAEARLLALAQIQGVLHYTYNSKAQEQPFTLTAAAPEVALAIPAVVTGATISLSASPSDGGAAVTLSLGVAGRIRLDLTSFAQYGPHVVPVECKMTAGDAPLFLEFIPDPIAGAPVATPEKFAFTPEQPNARWGYVAQSPFHGGYRFRPAAAGSESPKAWSDVQPPFGTLSLDSRGGVYRG